MKKKYVFTICSNNYLAQAKTLGDSVLEHNPDYKFIIALCDKKSSEVDYSPFFDFEIIEAHNLEIEAFDKMSAIYNIVELNTSIKPFVFKYIYRHFDADIVIYLDPDIMVFENFKCIENELVISSILLTPHIYKPIPFDDKNPTENTFTNYGIYNLGFLATKKSQDSDSLFEWLSDRMAQNCFIREAEGIFVDQLPMNFAPIFFNNIKITYNEGMNAAPWNLQERIISIKNGKYYVNNRFNLIFYHFSNYNPLNPEVVAVYYTRVGFNDNPSLKVLYDEYNKKLLSNGYEKYKTIKNFYSSDLSGWERTVKLPKSEKESIVKYMIQHPFFIFRKNFYKLLFRLMHIEN